MFIGITELFVYADSHLFNCEHFGFRLKNNSISTQ